MVFEWDKEKSNSNFRKHGIDFETAQKIWVDESRIEIDAPYPIERRSIVIGTIEDKVWTAIYTIRDDAIRIISVRRSRTKEKKIYDKKTLS
ncbi:MAG: toxin [Syntrophus sp. (in: bacteria)]|nr:toxin [Syntrophus sp. (in: bacteria)]